MNKEDSELGLIRSLMASSPINSFLFLLIYCALGWIFLIFGARLFAFLLSRITGASVGFRVAGYNCLRDVSVKLKKGSVESLFIGEIKLSLRKSLVKLRSNLISRDQKIELSICKLEVVIRPSERSIKKSKPVKPSKPKKSYSSGGDKWVLFANIARLLSVSVTELVLKVPKAAIEIKDIRVDISKSDGPNPFINVKIYLIPLLVQLCSSKFSSDDYSSEQGNCLATEKNYEVTTEKEETTFICEDFSFACEVGHVRKQGIKIKNLDLASGDITINLNEKLSLGNKKKSEVSSGSAATELSTSDATALNKPPDNKLSSVLQKHIIPDKVSFNLPKLDVKFVHQERGLFVENNVVGVHLRCMKSIACDSSGDTTAHFDVQLDFSEIHLLREGATSTLEIVELAVIASLDATKQPLSPIRTEVEVKLGRTQCNIIVSKLKPWLLLHSSKKKKTSPVDTKTRKERSQTSSPKAIMWKCTLSAPELAIMLYGINDLPLYRVSSQSFHLSANNKSSKGVQVHTELGELCLHMVDEHHGCLNKTLFSIELGSGSLLHIARVSLDFRHREVGSNEKTDPSKMKLVLAVDIISMGLSFSLRHVESLICTLMSFKALFKTLSPSGKKNTPSKVAHPTKSSTKGAQLVKLNLEKFRVNYFGDMSTQDMVVADPKRVNFGSQGGRTVITVNADGTPRTATITPTSPSCKNLKFSASFKIPQIKVCLNKEKQSLQVDLERAQSIYQEFCEDNKPCAEVMLLDMQKAKFVRRPSGANEVVRSLINVTDIAVRWEPDVHLAVFEIITSLKSVVHKNKIQHSDNQMDEEVPKSNTELSEEQTQADKKIKKKETVVAIDVEKLKVSAGLADGVETMICVESIFSENAKIGILLEELALSFNNARIFKSSRMQISRVPVSASKEQPTVIWDCVIQAPDFFVCLPYRLELRAIDDAVEDTLRALKLIIAAKTSLMLPSKQGSKKTSKPKSTKSGSVRLLIRRLKIEIEEEPLQGWLDEHHELMKKEICESAVRLKFLEELINVGSSSPEGSEQVEMSPGKKFVYNGIELDSSDVSGIKSLQEEIQKQAFLSYYQACQKLVPSEGSGACSEGFQSGFKPSMNRASVLSICAKELDVTLSKIEGGEMGMVEFINKMDPVSLDNEIPFARFYGCNISLIAGLLAVQIRNYTYPIFAATNGKCQGRVVLAQQATCFQPQMEQEVYVGRWWKVRMLRSLTGTTPAVKPYLDLPLHFNKGDISFGVSYEPVFADISYAFTVALRRAFLGTKGPNPLANLPPKKERSLPWWDDMRNYIHGKISLDFTETMWHLLATTNPYEKVDKLQIVTGYMEIQQSDGHVSLSVKEFKAYVSSLEGLTKNCTLKPPRSISWPFLYSQSFSVDVLMIWECDSGDPLNHYLFALPNEGKLREKVFDPFRSTSLSLRWNFLMQPSVLPNGDKSQVDSSPTVNFGVHDILWIFKWWNMYYLPPHKLRSFSRWPRFGVPRIVRSGNLSLDKVMTEFFLRFVVTPTCIKHMPLGDDDPSSGLTFRMAKLKFELCFSRGKQKFTFESFRDPLDLVYQGFDLHHLKAFLDRNVKTEKCRDDGFLMYSDYFTIRKQSARADAAKIMSWQEAGRKYLELACLKSEFGNGSDSDHALSDLSDDDEGFNVVVADSCQRVFVYGLKLLWTIENRNAVLSCAGGLSKVFAPPKPSPSRQYAQRKLLEEKQKLQGAEMSPDDAVNVSPSARGGMSSPQSQHVEDLNANPSPSPTSKIESTNVVVNRGSSDDSEEEGTRHFMVNVIQPQFNLHSEEANGRFLLAAASGRLLARSFNSVLQVGSEMLEKAKADATCKSPEIEPQMTWTRVEVSMMLEQVQAHVAPTDVDLGAGVQWLPRIHKSSPKVKRTGALLERVFMPCQMYFRYTRHKSGTPEMKVKPLKDLQFNSPNIAATMTSRQFQVMMDVLTNLLFARPPKTHNSLLLLTDDEDVEEKTDEVVPDGVEEVELAKIKIEQLERERKLLLDDIRMLSVTSDSSGDSVISQNNDVELWMITGSESKLVHGLKKELSNIKNSRKAASSALRTALHKAAQLRLMEKEKNKSPSYAMRISLKISKIEWGMIVDGKPFVEAEINDMVYDFDRDYKDVGIALLTTKFFVMRNCLPNAKSDTLLSAWNAPPDWGKNVMLRVNAKQGVPKDGNSVYEQLQVDIYPLRIHLNESMYRMIWGYFFPEEELVSHKRQEVWKVSTIAGTRRAKKNASGADSGGKSSDSSQALKLPNSKGSIRELRRSSSFDKTWDESVAESVANELVLQSMEETSKSKLKDSKPAKPGRSSNEEKLIKAQDDKGARPQRLIEFRHIKISQVELLVTYEGLVADLRLLMDAFRRDDFVGTWGRLFSRVKKHIIWGVLKSVTGMQGKKFTNNDKSQSQREAAQSSLPESDISFSDNNGGQPGNSDQSPVAWPKAPNDGAGDGFVTSVRGLFSTQKKKAKAFVLRTMRGDENELPGEWSDGDAEIPTFARQLTIAKAKKLIRRHTKKLESTTPKKSDGPSQVEFPFPSDSSDDSSSEELNE